MNYFFLKELVDAIQALLSEKYPNYTYEDIYEDLDIHFLGERHIRIKFRDWVNQQNLYVGLSVTEMFNKDVFSIKEMIRMIDNELKKFKEGKS